MEKSKILPPDLEDTRNQLIHWRKNKKSSREPIPEKLWEKAKDLAIKYSINDVSKHLRLNYTDLKKRILGPNFKPVPRKKPASFIELPSEKLFTQSECIIEMEDKSGCKMKMCFRGDTNLDLLELGKVFWRKSR